MRRALVALALLATLLVAAAAAFVLFPLRDPHPAIYSAPGVSVLRGARVWADPDSTPQDGVTLVLEGGRIAAMGPSVPVPTGAAEIPCSHCVVTAGFWNAHVHFTQPRFEGAAFTGAPRLESALAEMLGSRGFTTVVDTGSDLRTTISLRRRIESGELRGPRIYTAGAALYPPDGVPYYLKDALPFFILALLPQPATPEEAVRAVARNAGDGADLLKLFTGSYVARGRVLPMPLPVARAAVEEAHRRGQLVFSHASDRAGAAVALAAGVDVLAHALDSPEGVDAGFLSDLVAHKVALVPTLKMFATTVTTAPAYLEPITAQVRAFHQAGGVLLFGTDVGYMDDSSTEGELAALAGAGLGPREVLRMLTTAPATRFGAAAETGTVAPGKRADLVLLSADPSQDVGAFARVAATVRAGRVIYTAHE